MDLAEGIMRRDRHALARCISMIEDGSPEAREILAAIHPYTGRAHIIGVTGAPGTGKSTLVNGLAKEYRLQGVTVGIIAVDPSSPFSGGALLGDRIRMRDLSGDPDIFIRSMASRGRPGGLARTTASAIKVLDAAGFDKVIIETIGAGQAEVDIAQTAHTTVVLQVPGMGDDIQAIKAGLLEIADILVVNKADRDGADQVIMILEATLGLSSFVSHPAVAHGVGHRALASGQHPAVGEPREPDWHPPILKTIAIRGQGLGDLSSAIERHMAFLRESGVWAQRERVRIATELRHLIQETLMQRFANRVSNADLETVVGRIARRELDPYSAAAKLASLCLSQ